MWLIGCDSSIVRRFCHWQGGFLLIVVSPPFLLSMSHHNFHDCPLPPLVVAIPPTASTVVPLHLPSPPSSPLPPLSSSSLYCIMFDFCVCCPLLLLPFVVLLPQLPHSSPFCRSHHRLVRQSPQLLFTTSSKPQSHFFLLLFLKVDCSVDTNSLNLFVQSG